MATPSEVELKALHESLPYTLARQVGSNAVANALTDLLEAMSPAARVTALNSLAALVTALETVVDSSVRQEMHVVLDLTPDAKSQPVPSPDIAEIPQAELLPTVVKVQTLQEEAGEVQRNQLSKNPLTFLYGYTDSDYVDKLTLEHVDNLANALASAFLNHSPRTKRTQDEITTQLKGYFIGLKDKEIGEQLGLADNTVQVFRSQLFKKLKSKLGDHGVAALFAEVIGTEVIRHEAAPEASEIEDDIAETDDSSGTNSDVILRILDEYGVEEEWAQKTPAEKMYEFANELWDEQQILSLKSLVEERDGEVGPEVSRQALCELMDKFAPRWFRKLGIEKQATWEAAANILGYNRQPVSVSSYDRKHRASFGIQQITAQQLLVETVVFLFEKELSGAPKVPAARQSYGRVQH